MHRLSSSVPDHVRSRHLRTGVVIALVGAVISTSGCGGGDERDGGTAAGPAGAGRPPDRIAVLASACTAVINDRDSVTYLAGADANVAFEDATNHRRDPGARRRRTWLAAMTEARAALAAERDRVLAGPGGADATSVVAEPLRLGISTYDTRIAVLRSPRWPPPPVARLGGPGVADPDDLARLGLTHRDCTSIGTDAGPPPEHRRFVRAASSTCTAITDRRRVEGFGAARRTVQDAVHEAERGMPVEITEDRIDALRHLRDEWQRTAADFARVPTTDVRDPKVWRTLLRVTRKRASEYGQRLSAMERRDAGRVAATLGDRSDETAARDWTFPGIGIGLRDCGYLES